MEFKVNEIVILNENAVRGLPMRIGERCTIVEPTKSVHYEYKIEFDDGEIAPVKASELNKLTNEDKEYMDYIFTNNEVMLQNEKAKVLKVNYLTRQANIIVEDKIEYIVKFDDLQPIHIDILEEMQIDIYEDLLAKFFNHYKNKDGFYSVPKELLINLLKGLYTE